MGRNEGTVATFRVTNSGQTNGIDSARLGARNYRVGDDRTFVWNLLKIAEENSIAKIAIFKWCAIQIGLAVAVDVCALAEPCDALVSNGARIAIVTRPGNRGVLATSRNGAKIVSTRIVVIALHHIPNACPAITVVGNGTGVSVVAITDFEQLVNAPVFATTGVCGAVIVISAQLQVLALDQFGLINLAIAVIIDTVAGLGHRVRRIT